MGCAPIACSRKCLNFPLNSSTVLLSTPRAQRWHARVVPRHHTLGCAHSAAHMIVSDSARSAAALFFRNGYPLSLNDVPAHQGLQNLVAEYKVHGIHCQSYSTRLRMAGRMSAKWNGGATYV